jgi:hypothetical protein
MSMTLVASKGQAYQVEYLYYADRKICSDVNFENPNG